MGYDEAKIQCCRTCARFRPVKQFSSPRAEKCDRCKEQYAPSEPELLTAGLSPDDAASPGDFTLFKPVGCAVCAKTGYKGRFAIHEVMLMSEEIERAIVEARSSEDLRKLSISQGMLTLREDGLRKVLQGQTSLEELARVVA